VQGIRLPNRKTTFSGKYIPDYLICDMIGYGVGTTFRHIGLYHLECNSFPTSRKKGCAPCWCIPPFSGVNPYERTVGKVNFSLWR